MEELLHKLGIDWRLLIAQIVNFLVLLVILRKFLYRPVLKMLADRTEKIAQGLTDAEVAARRRKDIEVERSDALAGVAAERRSVLEAAVHEAEELRASRIAAAEQEAAAVVARATTDAGRLRSDALATVQRDAAELVGAIAQRVTADRLPASVHERIVRDAADALARTSLS